MHGGIVLAMHDWKASMAQHFAWHWHREPLHGGCPTAFTHESLTAPRATLEAHEESERVALRKCSRAFQCRRSWQARDGVMR